MPPEIIKNTFVMHIIILVSQFVYFPTQFLIPLEHPTKLFLNLSYMHIHISYSRKYTYECISRNQISKFISPLKIKKKSKKKKINSNRSFHITILINNNSQHHIEYIVKSGRSASDRVASVQHWLIEGSQEDVTTSESI